MKLIVNGLDITAYVERNGIKYSVNDVDKDAGRTLDGTMHRGRIATKVRLDVKCVPMNELMLQAILQKLRPTSFNVTYTDPYYGEITKKMYSNNYSATLRFEDAQGVRQYKDFEFPLVEI